METEQLLGVAAILVLGVAATWIAWRSKLPAILVLLVLGFIAGPISGAINPDQLIGSILLPIISIAVSIILFEGGLNLKIAGLRHTARVVRNLITIGVLVTWLVGGFGAYFFLGLEAPLAILIGAIFVVTGPTVIMPLLRYLRPTAQLNTIIKWEGVVVDPIGAILAVLVFQATLVGGFPEAATTILLNLLKTLLLAGVLGGVGAGIIMLAFRRYWIPDYLHNPVTLMMVIGTFAVSNWAQADSGLLTVTLMGIVLANQRVVSVKHIAEFKENLRVLIISSLFIILAARLNLTDLEHIGWGVVPFLALLILVARPTAVLISTFRSRLNWRERAFLSALAPRGVVAAAVASVFAIRLNELGYPQAQIMVPVAFVVITATVLIYGLSAPILARVLKVAAPDPSGVLLVGGSLWLREIAEVLHREGIKVLLVDTTWANVSRARMAGVPVFYGNILSEYALDEIDTTGMGYIIAGTSDDEYNSFVISQFSNIFGRDKSFQVSTETEHAHEQKRKVSKYLRGRVLFDPMMTGKRLSEACASGAIIKVTRLTPGYDYEAYRKNQKSYSIPLFIITEKGKLLVFSRSYKPRPQPYQKLISLVFPRESHPVMTKVHAAPANKV
jgi:NhaP-type Na+/H+ or K+/H+ antiporter